MKQSELLDSDLLFQYFGQIFSFFLSRLSKIEFPLEMNEKKIQAVLDQINLPDMNVHVFGECSRKKIFFPIYIDQRYDFHVDEKDYEIMSSSEKMKKEKEFQSHEIHLLYYTNPKNSQGHIAYIANINKLFQYLNPKDGSTFCVICSNFVQGTRFFSHRKLCRTNNPDNMQIRFPKTPTEGPNKGVPPSVKYLTGVNVSRCPSLCVINCEVSFDDWKEIQGSENKNEMKLKRHQVGLTGVISTLTLDVWSQDSERIKFLKNQVHVSELHENQDCVIKMMKDIFHFSLLTKRALNEIAREYQRVKLTKEDKEIIDNCDKCQNCSKLFLNRFEKRAHHSHWSSPDEKGARQADRGANFFKIYCVSCNALFRADPDIYRVFCANLFRYDLPMILLEIFKYQESGKRLIRDIKIIASTENVLKAINFGVDCEICFKIENGVSVPIQYEDDHELVNYNLKRNEAPPLRPKKKEQKAVVITILVYTCRIVYTITLGHYQRL